MKIKRILAVLWVTGLFLLLFGGFFMMSSGVDFLERAGLRIHPVYTQAD